MANKTVLITGVGGDIGQSIIKCLKDINRTFYLLGCDIDPYAAGRADVKKFFVAPRVSDSKKFFQFVTSIIKHHEVYFIYPTTEAEIAFFDAHRDYFEKKRVIVFINNHFIVNTFLDKYRTIKFLEERGIPCPRTFLLEKYKGQLGYPLIVKPHRGSSGRRVAEIDNAAALNFYKIQLPDAIVQECIGSNDEEYTTGVFSDGKKTFSITFKRLLGLGGISKIAKFVIDNRIADIAKQIAVSTNLIGSINIQLRKGSNGFAVFEINPRFSSTVYIRHYFGFQDVKWWMNAKEGKRIEYIPNYKKGVAVRTVNEIFFDLV